MIEPLLAESASANSAESRSGAKTLVSLTLAQLARLDLGDRVHRRDRERVVDDAVDPTERLEGLVAQVDARVLVGDVGDDAARPSTPYAASSAWSSRSRDSVRLAITRSAPILAASTASDRPRPGPMPEMTMTLPCSSGTGW